MTDVKPVEVIAERLVAAGYKRQPAAFRVTSFPVQFSAVLSGELGRSSDLIVIIDTRDDSLVGADGSRAVQRIEALTLALDVARWPVVVTAILVGPSLPAGVIEAVGRSCRTLTVSDETVEGIGDAAQLDDRLRILLPLEVEVGGGFGTDPITRLTHRLDGEPGFRLATNLVEASARGEDDVRRLLVRELDQVIQTALRA